MRAPRRPVLLLLPALAAALAGCGGPPNYKLAKTRSCLQDAGLKVSPPPADDFVARSATVGSFHAAFPGRDPNAVTISFGDNHGDAEQTSQGYVRFHAPNVGVFDILQVDRNAVLLWKAHPSDDDRATVTDCLR